MVTHDSINHPSHYVEGRKYETIDVIEDWGLGFRLGNALKYISRAGRKDPSKTAEDLRKAIFYIEREISALEPPEVPFELAYKDIVNYYEWDSDDSYMLEPNVTAAVEKDWEDFWVYEDRIDNIYKP